MSTLRIAHLSDPHFGTVLPEVEERLIATLRSLKPDLVLVSGDITQRARRAQFQAAAAFRKKMAPFPFFAVPGNHDIPLFNLFARLFYPYRGFHRYFQAARETDFRIGDVRVIGLNSTSRWRHVQGSLDLARIKEEFLSNWDTSKIRVAMVHHPIECAKDIDDKNRLRGKDETLALFKEAQIDLVLSGHVHDPYIQVEGSLVLSVAGTCLSWRIRKGAPNSFNWIEIQADPKRIKITRMDSTPDGLYLPRADFTREFRFEQGRWG